MLHQVPRRLPGTRRAALIVLAAAGMTAAAGCAATPGQATATGATAASATRARATATVVPWTGRPAPAPVIQSPLPAPSPATSAPPCTATSLSAQPELPSGLAGSVDYWVKLVNIGHSTCLASGYPKFALLTGRGGGSQRLTLTHHGGLIQPLEASDIRPGAAAYLNINGQFDCNGGGGGTSYPLLRLGLPGGGSVLVHAWGTGVRGWDFPCPPDQVSSFGVMPPQPVYPPLPWAGIRVRLALPTTVRAGTTLGFVVYLTNATGHSIRLTPCPGYLEYTNAFSTPVKLAYALNCGAVHAIPAHAAVGFAMRMPIPATAKSGPATIFWTLAEPSSPPAPARARVRVVAGSGSS